MAETDEQLNDTNDIDAPADAGDHAESNAAELDPMDALQNEVEDLRDKHLRALAEVQNTRRRGAQDAEEARKQGARRILDSIVPVLDHFDLALAQDPAQTTAEQIISGVSVIRDQFRSALATAGVTEIVIEPGAEFDPHRCEAVTRQPSDEIAEGLVLATFQTGYAHGERVIRPAKVAVSAGPAGTE